MPVRSSLAPVEPALVGKLQRLAQWEVQKTSIRRALLDNQDPRTPLWYDFESIAVREAMPSPAQALTLYRG